MSANTKTGVLTQRELIRTAIQLLIVVVIMPFLPLLITQRWDWWEAWLFAFLFILSFVVSRAIPARKYPDLLMERTRSLDQENAQPWDRVIAPVVALGFSLLPLIAGLEALFGWSKGFSIMIEILALVVILAGYTIATYALIENRFFSGVVRIQSERGHQVVSSGPYRVIRHPGYAGAVLYYLATPFLLDSWWALLPAVIASVLLIIRTHLEDRFLQNELTGYREYASRVHYRLFLGVW